MHVFMEATHEAVPSSVELVKTAAAFGAQVPLEFGVYGVCCTYCSGSKNKKSQNHFQTSEREKNLAFEEGTPTRVQCIYPSCTDGGKATGKCLFP